MSVVSVEAIPVAYPEPNDHGAERHLLLVRVVDSSGAVGWGEAVTMWPEASRATAELVRGLGDLVVGRDPVAVDAIWRSLREHTWWYGGAGIASFAIATLDIALWDLRGQLLGRPLLDLLGGPAKQRLPAIASSHATHVAIEDLVGEIAAWVDGRAEGAKVGFGKRGDANLGFSHERDVAFVGALREALGPQAQIMVDLGVRVRWSVAEAVARTRAFEAFGLHWIEEPLGADDPAGYETLRAKTTTLIAYGEREWNVRGLERIVASGTCDVAGIDPGRAEGISGFLRAARAAEAAGTQVNAHSWSSAIVHAASLALSWATPNAHQLEFKPHANAMQQELAGDTFVAPAAGGWALPSSERPGLGIEVDETVVERYRLDR
ncbi:mandelate racemase/muconate lactonizing enzyme family protein [Conexibacter sp. JD483]|uniref:mandelate racemase/muconate lactonizing enzyme family protein n=1 Tax=unclassified Conexibacter TaxID=2627773 RepID=UPI0027203BC7|nr:MULTISPECIES: mandelate racemase/muconate lactonizing enzyme family protein [unclassified Conexibacter]MDO8187064.1 mandelate racemase/muconate lactonizing enzyme family protein [Conexibacter sp. CPCC 205706]MDO8200922.1 mandelate racemase/muconate lactonizing enzyme family protein [Conexibacter sp. CPCC 205762]MDR9371304.1 mandelate racemase/muconate lactonizing enzyme family protein [Conexibacter sp. JD483]